MLGVTLDVGPFLARVGQELMRIDQAQVRGLAELIYDCYRRDRLGLRVRHGGSGSNASHFCEDVGKGSLRREDFDDEGKKRVRILSLTDNTPYILAWGNDDGLRPHLCRAAQEPRRTGRPARCHLLLRQQPQRPAGPVEWAKPTGRDDDVPRLPPASPAARLPCQLAQHGLHVPLDDMGIVETAHLAAFHWFVDDLHRRIGLGGQARVAVVG